MMLELKLINQSGATYFLDGKYQISTDLIMLRLLDMKRLS